MNPPTLKIAMIPETVMSSKTAVNPPKTSMFGVIVVMMSPTFICHVANDQ